MTLDSFCFFLVASLSCVGFKGSHYFSFMSFPGRVVSAGPVSFSFFRGFSFCFGLFAHLFSSVCHLRCPRSWGLCSCSHHYGHLPTILPSFFCKLFGAIFSSIAALLFLFSVALSRFRFLPFFSFPACGFVFRLPLSGSMPGTLPPLLLSATLRPPTWWICPSAPVVSRAGTWFLLYVFRSCPIFFCLKCCCPVLKYWRLHALFLCFAVFAVFPLVNFTCILPCVSLYVPWVLRHSIFSPLLAFDSFASWLGCLYSFPLFRPLLLV